MLLLVILGFRPFVKDVTICLNFYLVYVSLAISIGLTVPEAIQHDIWGVVKERMPKIYATEAEIF